MNQQYAQAIPPLELAWKRDSSNARVGALLATAYLRTGAARKAIPVLRAAAGHSEKDPAPLLLLVEALEASLSLFQRSAASLRSRYCLSGRSGSYQARWRNREIPGDSREPPG
jgi:hypothetical protein